MTANTHEEINNIVELKNRATRLDTLIQGYRLCACTEGKSDKTILSTTTTLNKLRQFLESRGYPTDVIEIGTQELREFILYLQHYRPKPTNPLCPTLFLIAAGNPITTDRLRTIIEKYTSRAGIEGVRCSPHTFRHTCAISYLRNGGDVFSLQRKAIPVWKSSGFMSTWRKQT